MKYPALILSCIMALQFNLLLAPAYADTITVTTTTTSAPGGINGQIAITKVGALIAGDALAILNGTEIKIESKIKSKSTNSTTSTPPNDLLNGVLMQTKTIANAASGYAVFNGGDRFSRINSSVCPDRVTTTAGTTYTGTITQATANALTMSTSSGTQSINTSDIAEIHSARAFRYNIADYNGPAPKMSFTTTCVHAAAAASHGNKTKKLIIIALALTVVAVAVAVPVAVSASHHHHNNNTNNLILANYIKSRQTVPTPAMPAGTSMPTAQQLGASYLANLNRSSSSVSGRISQSQFSAQSSSQSVSTTSAPYNPSGI